MCSRFNPGDIVTFSTKEGDLGILNGTKCLIVNYSDEEDVGPMYEIEFINARINAFESKLHENESENE